MTTKCGKSTDGFQFFVEDFQVGAPFKSKIRCRQELARRRAFTVSGSNPGLQLKILTQKLKSFRGLLALRIVTTRLA